MSPSNSDRSIKPPKRTKTKPPEMKTKAYLDKHRRFQIKKELREKFRDKHGYYPEDVE